MDASAIRILKNQLFSNNQMNPCTILLLLIAGISLGCLVQYLWNRRFLYYCSWKMRGPSPAWPMVGNALRFAGGTDHIFDNIVRLSGQFKSPFRVWFGPRLFFTIAQPKDLEILLNRSLHKDPLYDFAIPIVGTGIFSAALNKWKPHRKVVAQTFKPAILNSFVGIFAEQSNILVEKLRKFSGKGCFDVCPLVKRCALDMICEAAMGEKMHSQTHESDYDKWMESPRWRIRNLPHQIGFRAMEIIFIRVFHVWLHLDFLWKLSALSKELDELTLAVKQFTLKIIEEKKQEHRRRKCLDTNDASSGRKVFLDHLIELSEGGDNWDDDEILEETLTLLIAGSDTTATLESFILIMLAMHQDIQQKVYEELQAIFDDDHNRNITTPDLSKMLYLERVVKETLRLFPAAPIIGRAVYEDLKLDSYSLPKNSSCILAIIHTHRDPELWPDPLKFDPDRFLPDEMAKRHPYSYIPFSAGPRNCIGLRYAMMAMKTVIATILRRYKVTATDYKRVEDIKLTTNFVIKAAEGYKIALMERDDIL